MTACLASIAIAYRHWAGATIREQYLYFLAITGLTAHLRMERASGR